MTNFKKFWIELTDVEKEDYANRVGTTAQHISAHWVSARKVPRRKTIAKIVKEAHGKLTREDVLDHFYKIDEVDAA